MININEETKKFSRSNLDDKLKSEYAHALTNEKFKKLVNKLKVKEDIAYKYTSKLERTIEELDNCSKCKSLHMCQNKVCGSVYYPTLKDDALDFNYVACKYKKEDLKNKEEIKSKFFEMPYEIRLARLSNIEIDKDRAKVMKWIKKFYDNYKINHYQKGLYLHGSFGSGKTYMISALLNELSKDNTCLIIYYPELLRSIKETFNTQNDDFSNRIKEIKEADLLLLDDIGAESVTQWNRDEILGTILQYRMDSKKPTFFTSNLSLNELEEHFIIGKSVEEQVKAKRIMERIKQLTEEEVLISENRRK